MDAAPTRKVIHVDMDAFFASVEQRDNPLLRDRPVAVGHPAARGVVAAASYEARQFGVRSALPSVTALRRCPGLVFVPPRSEVYRAISRDIHRIFADYTSLIQPLSLDEAYLDVTENRQRLPTAWATAREIRARILAETDLTASAGISYNKFLAKLASGHRKPNGQFAVIPGMGAAWVKSLPVARFHGVGPVTAKRMLALRIETGADLREQSMEFLQAHFGKAAAWYYGIARGEDHRPVDPDRTRKSSGSETTFHRDLVVAAEIEAGVLTMADDVWAWCETAQAFGRTVTVKVKFADFRQVTRSRSYAGAVNDRAKLRQASLDLVRSVLPARTGVRLVGVTVSNFEAPMAGMLGCHCSGRRRAIEPSRLSLSTVRLDGPPRRPGYRPVSMSGHNARPGPVADCHGGGRGPLLAWSAQTALLIRVPSVALRGGRWDELDEGSLNGC